MRNGSWSDLGAGFPEFPGPLFSDLGSGEGAGIVLLIFRNNNLWSHQQPLLSSHPYSPFSPPTQPQKTPNLTKFPAPTNASFSAGVNTSLKSHVIVIMFR